MAEECTVVRFTRDPSTARIETLKNESPDKFQDQSTTFGAFYVICIALSIITYVLDIVLACVLLYFYSVEREGTYFALTLTFMLVPALFMTTFSLRWYIVDHDDPSIGKTSLTQWIIRILFLLLQIAPLLRYIDTLIYGIKSKVAKSAGIEQWQVTMFRRMLDEDTNSALLRLFHCFLHSAPQAVIQLMLLLNHISYPETRELKVEVAVIQAWTVIAALISIAWALTSYHRSTRYARDDKEKVTAGGTTVAFLWHFLSAVSRVLALSMLASIYPAWMGCMCALHWGVSAFWLAIGHHQTAACSNRCEELLLSTALGLAYVLAFLSPRDGPTRYQYLAYYLVCFMENTGALVVWCVSNNSHGNVNTHGNVFLYYGTPATQLISFLLALICLLIYYKYCHPSTAGRTRILEITDPNTPDIDKPTYSKSYSQRSYS